MFIVISMKIIESVSIRYAFIPLMGNDFELRRHILVFKFSAENDFFMKHLKGWGYA